MVDDDADTRHALASCLSDAGYEVVVADNGKAALSALATMERPVVVLLDLMMPEMDGWEFMRQLRGDRRFDEVAVAIITAVSGTALATAPVAGAYLRKPVKPHELLEAVDRCRARNERHGSFRRR